MLSSLSTVSVVVTNCFYFICYYLFLLCHKYGLLKIATSKFAFVLLNVVFTFQQKMASSATSGHATSR